MIHPSLREERGWLSGGIVAGAIGTFAAAVGLAVGYVVAGGLAVALPRSIGASFEALISNTATESVASGLGFALLLHFAVGIGLGVVYSGAVEPRLDGPGWRRGMLFALIPWILSLVFFLPAVGGGFLGLRLGAGILPIVGNLIVHLIYGATLGWSYARGRAELRNEDEASALANLGAERGIALGVALGAIAGAAFALIVGPVWLGPGTSNGWSAMIGAVAGATIGAFFGSFFGLGEPSHRPG